MLCFLDHTINLCEEVLEQSLRRLERIWDTFVACVPVVMVVGQALPSELELLRWLHRVCVVVAEDPCAKPIMQREAVSDAMTSMRQRRNLPCLDLDPEADLLLQDAAVQFKKRLEAGIGTCSLNLNYIIC